MRCIKRTNCPLNSASPPKIWVLALGAHLDACTLWQRIGLCCNTYRHGARKLTHPVFTVGLVWRLCGGGQGCQVETAVNKFGDKDVRWSSQGMIRLSLEAMKRLFEPTVERIKQAIHDVITNVSGQILYCCFILHSCCITVSVVGCTWWDWSLILWTYLSSVLWHCWFGHLTRKNRSPMSRPSNASNKSFTTSSSCNVSGQILQLSCTPIFA